VSAAPHLAATQLVTFGTAKRPMQVGIAEFPSHCTEYNKPSISVPYFAISVLWHRCAQQLKKHLSLNLDELLTLFIKGWEL